MRVLPELSEVVRGKRGIFAGIESCLDTECLVSAITLIYAGIDALAALTRPLDMWQTNKRIFKEWVERYFPPAFLKGCSPDDLYAARCGVLHTYGGESAMTDCGKARILIYKWRYGPAPTPEAARLATEAIVLQIEDLYDAFRDGVTAFEQETEFNIEMKCKVQENIKPLHCYRPWSPIQVFDAA